jgi:hypothetical protein
MITFPDDEHTQEIYNGFEALERIQKGRKVRRIDWQDGEYVYEETIYRQIVNNAGTMIDPQIFVDADSMWEDYDPDWALDPDPPKAPTPTASAPKVSEHERMYEFFKATKKPNRRCDCGAQHTGEPHSDWCSAAPTWINKLWEEGI